MEFQFDPDQEFQIDAIEAVCGVFEDQRRNEVELNFTLGGAFGAIANSLDLEAEVVLANLKNVQAATGIDASEELVTIDAKIETVDGEEDVSFPNFSVEMETGTGKTYVYLRTALELCRRYGFRKFIVVVPSVPIREGVLKDLTITEEHFHKLFGNVPYRYYVYDSENLSQVRQFAQSDCVEFMVMTLASFNKAANIIHRTTDRLQGETPVHLIQATRPILILDEPQNMESEGSIAALATLNPLFALRFSATPRNPYNLVYRLTPYEAYRQGLVKRIEVASVLRQDDENQPYMRLDRIDTQKRTITARIVVHALMKGGSVKEKVVTVKPGESLETKTGRNEYAGFEIEEISPGGNFVRFANTIELTVGDAVGADERAIFEAQIRYTIEEHFRKQERLRRHGIKILSLFFIDRVDNYVPEDGLIRNLFVEGFNDLKAGYPAWKSLAVETVHAGYFAQKRRTGGKVEFIDSASGETNEDRAAYDLIMRKKEQLLSFDEPVSFIFSHSALREGWDNPNVFQICTLNQTTSDVKKRQEVGRGVRLCRDQSGARVHDERINVLTVVANESYEKYVSALQSEIESEYGPSGTPPKPPDARKPGKAKLRKAFTLKPEFKELWGRIKHKTRYSVKIDTDALLDDVLPAVDAIKVRKPRIAVTKALVEVGTKDAFAALQMSAAKTTVDLVGRFPLPNIVDLMANVLENTSPPVRLTRATLLTLFRRTSNQTAALENPQDFAAQTVRILKEKLADHLVSGIQYEKIGAWYEMTQLEEEIDSWAQYLVPSPHGVYDHVVFQSGVEKAFVEDLEKRDDIRLYVKLPNWFKVPTPVGEYNPDWAIVMEDRDEHGDPTPGTPLLYLVRETKDATYPKGARPSERRKVECGQHHFQGALGVNYRVVTYASDLP